MAKKVKKAVRREYTKADVKELRAHSKAKTPVAKIAKLTKRSETALRHHEQIHGGNVLSVVSQKGPPSLTWRSMSLDHVLGDG